MGHSGAAMKRALFGFVALLVLVPLSGMNAPWAIAQVEGPAVTGQVLDYEGGYLFFTTGDGFAVAPHVKIVDVKTKAPSAEAVRPRLYARAVFDTATGMVITIELSHKPLPSEMSFADARKYAVVASTPAPNPDLVQNTGSAGKPGAPGYHEALTGLPVIVTFEVQVPPNTPLTDRVYISTDQSGWNPQAIRMDRIDAMHYRVVKNLNSGTVFHYRYTRGSPTTVEKGINGMERPPRVIEVTNLDVKNREDIVYHWGDETLSGQSLNPLAVPTPYNPNPFGNLPQNPKRPVPTPPPH